MIKAGSRHSNIGKDHCHFAWAGDPGFVEELRLLGELKPEWQARLMPLNPGEFKLKCSCELIALKFISLDGQTQLHDAGAREVPYMR